MSFHRQTQLVVRGVKTLTYLVLDQGTLECIELSPQGVALGVGGVIHAVYVLSAD